MAREAWTEERLDDLNARVGRLENRMDAGFAEMRQEFAAIRTEAADFRSEITAQFAAQNRTLVQLFGGMFATTVVGFLGVIAAFVTQT